MMEEFLNLLATIASCCFYSAAHGNGSEPHESKIMQLLKGKRTLVAAHLLMVFGLTTSMAMLLVPALFWGFFRRGEQAKTEINYLSGTTTLRDIANAYPVHFIGALVAVAIQELKVRRWQEWVGAGVISSQLGAAVIIVSFVYGV